MTKYCMRCKQTKPVTEFGKNKARKDGLTFYCKECNAKMSRERWRTDPETKKYRRDYTRNWRNKKKIQTRPRKAYKDLPKIAKENRQGYRNLAASMILLAYGDVFSRDKYIKASANEFFKRGLYKIPADLLGIPQPRILKNYRELLKLQKQGITPYREELRLV